MEAAVHARIGRVLPPETLTPPSHKKRPPRVPKENVEPNTMPLESSLFRSPPVSGKTSSIRVRSPLPPRPPPSSASSPLKRKLNLDTLPENESTANDSGVQVVLRMRPLNKEEENDGNQIAQKISFSSISILDHKFTFDSVADSNSSQQDIFELVGIPLVENCLAGFNSSIFAYGQTGSGKTYTMWGPANSLTADTSLSQERGLTPRVFELLFSRIYEEEAKHSDKQLSYQCHCSFLEIYNEQITDLLDPTQRNLQIREDIRTGVYVDCLTEEYGCSLKDVIELLVKGLSNRRIGATSINSESSRSHCVFTCVVRCRSKNLSDGLSSLRTSRINLVDLAGSERQKTTLAAGERLKEAGSINRSLSQLGNLINILAEVSQSGKQRHIPYRDSRLTFLLQDSLGGNAKLAMICAISPSHSCKSETLSTLRFAQRAKAIKNQAVVNETMEEDVSVLREQIRQLKDELLRIKSNDKSAENNNRNCTKWNVQRSLNLLKLSLCRPRTLPAVDDDSDEEMEIVRESTETIRVKMHLASEFEKSCANEVSNSLKNSKHLEVDKSYSCLTLNDKNSLEVQYEMGKAVEKVLQIKIGDISEIADKKMPNVLGLKEAVFLDESELVTIPANRKSLDESLIEHIIEHDMENPIDVSTDQNQASPCCLSTVVASEPSFNLTFPVSSASPSLHASSLISSTASMESLSPRLEKNSRKSTIKSSYTSQKSILPHVAHNTRVLYVSVADGLKHSNDNARPVFSSRSSLSTTELLSASIQKGLQLIDSKQRSSFAKNSSFRFSLKPDDVTRSIKMSKIDIGIQTLPQELRLTTDLDDSICCNCENNAPPIECENISENVNMQMVLVDEYHQSANKSHSMDRCKKFVPKAVKKILAGAIRREMALEDHCAMQTAEIMHLNRLVQQYKHERECLAIIEQTREDKISRLECLMDGVLPKEEFMEEEHLSLKKEHMMLKEKYENHPEVLRLKIELNRAKNDLDGCRNFFEMGERDVLIEELQDLRSQVHYFLDYSLASACTQNLLVRSTHSIEPIAALAAIPETKKESAEKLCWTQKESKWVLIADELRMELKTSCALTDKLKVELELEKKCTEELKEALQTALEVHTRTLEHYAELEEKHMALLGRHRKMREGLADMRNAAARAGVKGSESNYIESLAAQIEALRVEREKERRYWRDEKKGLQVQLRDTVEALEAAGEVLIRLKQAEDFAAKAQKQFLAAEQRTEKAHQEIADLKTNHRKEITTLNQLLEESCSRKEPTAENGLYSWFYNYDRCNM